MDLILRNLFCCQHYFLSIQTPVILSFFNTMEPIGVARGAKWPMATPKFLENIAILCFERRFSKQNSVIRLESNI